MDKAIAFIVGVAVGAAALFGFYQINPPGASSAAPDVSANSGSTGDTSSRGTAASGPTTGTGSTLTAISKSSGKKAPPKEEQENGFAEAMQDFGKAQADLAFDTLVERLGLEGAELERFEKIFNAMRTRRQAAYGKIMGGGATLEEFALIDGATPSVDTWAQENLSGDTLAEYDSYKTEQVANRIERKANEELMWLNSTANLTPDQKDAAFGVFADHIANEPAEMIMDFQSYEELETNFNDAMASRATALGSVLDERQLENYEKQTGVMLKMMKGMVQGSFPDTE